MTRHVDPQVKAMLVARLREQRAAGTLRSAEVRDAAREVGIGERTLWRWLATTESPPRRRRRDRYEITEADRDAYAEWHGNIAAVHRALHAGRAGAPSLRRLQAAFIRDLVPGERAAAVEGVEGRRRHEVYLRWAPNWRNALWESDHTELPVLGRSTRSDGLSPAHHRQSIQRSVTHDHLHQQPRIANTDHLNIHNDTTNSTSQPLNQHQQLSYTHTKITNSLNHKDQDPKPQSNAVHLCIV